MLAPRRERRQRDSDPVAYPGVVQQAQWIVAAVVGQSLPGVRAVLGPGKRAVARTRGFPAEQGDEPPTQHCPGERSLVRDPRTEHLGEVTRMSDARQNRAIRRV